MSRRFLLPRHTLWQIRRCLSTSASESDVQVAALDKWISHTKSLVLTDTLTPTHLADLYITLPTRDGTRGQPYQPPQEGAPLACGHHLAFFHPRNPEAALRPDGTDSDFCPPDPFTRRMWAGGTMRWNQNPACALRVGDKALAVSTIAGVEKKGFDDRSANPMVFSKKDLMCTLHPGETNGSLGKINSNLRFGSVQGLPTPDFSFTYKPTLTTLFRFSALTFNGHYIHLDKDYAQQKRRISRFVAQLLRSAILDYAQ
ncbi:hypothetical protein BU15DRAFT_73050 [Melanogaster broomeanus]|nr:hypothetical protein BU15DRAFT_73050 [Melanogaster broomeanus]